MKPQSRFLLMALMKVYRLLRQATLSSCLYESQAWRWPSAKESLANCSDSGGPGFFTKRLSVQTLQFFIDPKLLVNRYLWSDKCGMPWRHFRVLFYARRSVLFGGRMVEKMFGLPRGYCPRHLSGERKKTALRH